MWSLAMIVKNGAEHLAQTLESAKVICDELIVVDTGSTDNTVEIAKSFGAKVFQFDWIDDFGAARNESFKHCTGDWIIWLDCGDVIPPEAVVGFQNLKKHLAENGDDFDFVWLNINRGIADDGSVVFRFNTPRLVRRTAFAGWVGAVHEYLDKSGERAMLGQGAWVNDPLALNNKPTERNLKILQRLIDDGDESNRTAFYYANELRDLKRWPQAISAYKRFIKMKYLSWEYYDALISLAMCHKQVNDEDAMIDCYHQAIRFDPTRAEAFVGLGDLHYEKNHWPAAVPFYAAALESVRPMEGFVLETCYTWLPWDRLAVCYGNTGRIDKAIEATIESLKSCPERDRLMANLGMFMDGLKTQAAQNGKGFQ